MKKQFSVSGLKKNLLAPYDSIQAFYLIPLHFLGPEKTIGISACTKAVGLSLYIQTNT